MFLINDEIKSYSTIISPFSDNNLTKIGYILHVSETTNIQPFQSQTINSAETLNVYEHIAPLIFNITSNFIIVPSNIQPGYNGTLAIKIINPTNQELVLTAGDQVCEIRFTTLGRVPC